MTFDVHSTFGAQLTDGESTWINETTDRLVEKFAAERERVGAQIPYIAHDGRYEENMAEVFPGWWVNGFWPGILWQMTVATACLDRTSAANADHTDHAAHGRAANTAPDPPSAGANVTDTNTAPIPHGSNATPATGMLFGRSERVHVSDHPADPKDLLANLRDAEQSGSLAHLPSCSFAFAAPAREIEETVLYPVLADYERVDHDLGFVWLLSGVADWRITGSPTARIHALHAATMLAGRFNPVGRFIRAWNEPGREGWAIVDSLMNMPLMFWASRETNDPRFAAIARMHADTMLRTIVRPDGSCNHIVQFDPETGEFVGAPAGQGYAEGSSWSRGQSWAIYGFALMYRHTGDRRYLDAACRVARYFVEQVTVTGGLARLDFRQPDEPLYYDAIASCVAADGLLELARALKECAERQSEETAVDDTSTDEPAPALTPDWCLANSLTMLHAVDDRACDWDADRDGLVQLCSVEYHDPERIHIPIVYADYFFLETVLRLKGIAADLWW
ncbi:hypothetical protein EP30_06600 [Bifidobacterium sp. UTCIF-39]|uniref:glycoside hydrolase family 88 protein n=1 Tax=Bifidobacterium sp. UTCIF-39 TaxID=1465359 RepID=UPI001C612EA5|nr:glycoside hydrolase family 88 protein [Bifidobacterium sp. UTCIF-39]TPF96671.1 hypothetical protein EP30_06600 [Bifidobacterium sp. UTCIF-39]